MISRTKKYQLIRERVEAKEVELKAIDEYLVEVIIDELTDPINPEYVLGDESINNEEELYKAVDAVIMDCINCWLESDEIIEDEKLEEAISRENALRSLEIAEEEITKDKIETLNSIYNNSTNSVEGWDSIDTSIEEVEELNKEDTTDETLTAVKEEPVVLEEFNDDTLEEKNKRGPAFILLSFIILSLLLLGIVIKVSSLCFNTFKKVKKPNFNKRILNQVKWFYLT